MTDISSTAGAGTTGATGTTPTSATAGSNSSLGSSSLNQLDSPQVFLQLLVAELQNQDPTNPMDPSTIMSQTSELAQMQAVNTMTTAINSEQTAAQTGEATTLIGHTIQATVNGAAVNGTVSSVSLDSSGNPSLLVGSTTVPLSAITSIS